MKPTFMLLECIVVLVKEKFMAPLSVADPGASIWETLNRLILPAFLVFFSFLYSQAIVYYLAEKYTNYAGFGKNNERPLIESVINWAATTLLRDIGNNYVYPSLNWPGVALAKESNSSLVDFGKNEVIFHLDVLEKHYLCHHEFLCGNSSTIADCWVAVVLSLLELVCFDLTPWPRLRSWVCSMKSNGDYVDVSYNHEEMVRKSFYNLNSSTSDLKTVSVENLT